MNEEKSTLSIVDDLSSIFPDIDGELCSRHSSLMGKLKSSFNNLYGDLNPSHFVIVKGIANIIETEKTSLSFALQNGIILLVSKTYENTDVYLNGNHIDQEIIFSPNGQHKEGLHELNEQFQQAFSLAVDAENGLPRFGGIIYIHANIPQDLFEYKKSLLLAFYVSILLINDRINSTGVEEIIQKLFHSNLIPDLEFLESQFYDYSNRNFTLRVADQSFQVPLQKNLKFVLCKLGLASRDLEYIQSQTRAKEKNMQKILSLLKSKQNFHSFYKALLNKMEIQCIFNEPELTKLSKKCMMQLTSLCQFSNLQMDAEKFIQMKWDLNKDIFPQEVLDLVEDIKDKTKTKSCMMVNNQYLLLVVDSKRYAEMICLLRQLLHKGKLKSKSCFKIDEELVEDRWVHDQTIGQTIFASAPSSKISIFSPSDSIWFDL